MPPAAGSLDVGSPHAANGQQQQHQDLQRPYSAGAAADHAADSPSGQRSSMGGAAEAAAVPEIDASAVILGKRLGAGAYATVYVAQLEGAKKPVVVKRLDRVGPAEEQQVGKSTCCSLGGRGVLLDASRTSLRMTAQQGSCRVAAVCLMTLPGLVVDGGI